MKLHFIGFSIRVIGGILVRSICTRQTDLKSIIAYYSEENLIQFDTIIKPCVFNTL